MSPVTAEAHAIGPVYRYVLRRQLAAGQGRLFSDAPASIVLFVMLNPSTADQVHDDRTISRCVRFAARWGFDELRVVNLYAARSTDPGRLFDFEDPIGPRNDWHLLQETRRAQTVVAAWGVQCARVRRRAADVVRRLVHVDWRCLGTTKDGHPRHPLYVPAATDLVRWSCARVERAESDDA